MDHLVKTVNAVFFSHYSHKEYPGGIMLLKSKPVLVRFRSMFFILAKEKGITYTAMAKYIGVSIRTARGGKDVQIKNAEYYNFYGKYMDEIKSKLQ